MTNSTETDFNEANQSQVALSMVVEWENVLLSGDDRAFEMLRTLASQIDHLLDSRPLSAEVLLVVDSENDVGHCENILHDAFSSGNSQLALRVVDAKGVPYFEKKNVGAFAARGEIIFFLDSDVLPEDHWLPRIFAAFDDSNVQVVAGSTYLDYHGLYSSAMALFWFFPPRTTGNELTKAQTIFGNNIAFRREIFLANAYPPIGQFRGQMGIVAKSLADQGITIYQHSGARCAHPAPNGFIHFLRRAICQGHDNVVGRRNSEDRVPIRISYWTLRGESRLAFTRIRERRAKVVFSRTRVLLAHVVAMSYISGIVLGEQMSRISPTFVRRWFSI